MQKKNRYQYLRGEIITGTILSRDNVYTKVNIGGMNVGVIDNATLPDIYNIGDAVLAVVTDQQTESGELVLDYTTANENAQSKLITLKAGETLQVVLSKASSVGLHGHQAGYDVFLPFSQMTSQQENEKNSLLNHEIPAVIVQTNLYKNTVIVSTKLLN